MKIETDRVEFLGGVRGGETLGGPIVLRIENRDHANWQGRMGAAPFEAAPEKLTRPRPGHADLAGGLKYDRKDLRDILERASARETAGRVAVGGVCRKLLGQFGIEVFAHVVSIGGVEAEAPELPWGELRDRARASDVGCADEVAAAKMRQAILDAAHAGDTLGGVFEVVALGVPPGLGSHVQWDRKLDGRIGQALMSIHAIKGVEIGMGFGAARVRGSSVHDPIDYDMAGQGFGAQSAEGDSKPQLYKPGFTRPTNHAGGLEGGITNGQPIVIRIARKPISTLYSPKRSVDINTKEPFEATVERSDICTVPAAGVVGEAVIAYEMANAMLEKFGGDTLAEMKRNFDAYQAYVKEF